MTLFALSGRLLRNSRVDPSIMHYAINACAKRRLVIVRVFDRVITVLSRYACDVSHLETLWTVLGIAAGNTSRGGRRRVASGPDRAAHEGATAS